MEKPQINQRSHESFEKGERGRITQRDTTQEKTGQPFDPETQEKTGQPFNPETLFDTLPRFGSESQEDTKEWAVLVIKNWIKGLEKKPVSFDNGLLKKEYEQKMKQSFDQKIRQTMKGQKIKWKVGIGRVTEDRVEFEHFFA